MKAQSRRNSRLKVDLLERGEREDTLGTNVYSAKDNQSLHKSLNGQFILYQLLVERLLDETFEWTNTKFGIYDYFKPDNLVDQTVMKEFDHDYKSEKAVHWYTRETCVYKILNKALRTQNIDDVTAFAKLVRDLHKQLKEQHREFSRRQRSSILTVYRGQFISKDELTRLKTAKGELFSMNSFLSTSSNKNQAMEFANSRSLPSDTLQSILLEIHVNIKSVSRPLADIKHLSAFSEEEEILFMFGCIFRLDDIWYDEESKLWKLHLTLCGDADLDMQDFTSSLDTELNGKSRLITLGVYLFQMQKYRDAQEHYEKILENKLVTDPIELAYCYHGLAQVNEKKMDYQAVVQNLEQALDYLLNNSPEQEHTLISKCYNDLGSIYNKQAEYQLAFDAYEKALKTANNVPSTTYSGLAQVHSHRHNYHFALHYLQLALDHQPPNAHAFIASTYIDIGGIYAKINQTENALKMFERAIECQSKTFGPDHPDVSYTYTAMASMYADIHDYDKALELIDKALHIQLHSLPNNHSDFVDTYRHFADIHMANGDVDTALSYYHKALDNQQKTLAWNHPSIAITYTTIASAHRKKRDYKQALVFFHKVLDSELTRKNIGDPSLSAAHKTLGDVYAEKGDTDQCVHYYLQYVQNELQTKLHEHMSLAETYQMVANIYYRKRMLSEALLYYNRLLDCHLQKKPFDEEVIKDIYTMIGRVYLKKHRVDRPLTHYGQGKSASTTDQAANQKSASVDFENIANVHFEKRHLDQTLNYFEKRLVEQLKILPRNDPSIGETYRILGNVFYEKGDLTRALNCFLHLLANKFTTKHLEHARLSKIYRAIGMIYLKKNQLEQALIYFNRLLACRMLERNSAEDSLVMEAYHLVGKVYLAKNDFNRPFTSLNKSLVNQNKILPNLTNSQFERRQLEQSLVYYHKLLEKKSKETSAKPFSLEDVYAILGNMFLEKQDYHRASRSFQQLLVYQLRKSLRGDLSSANTYAVLGNVHSQSGHPQLALDNYRYGLSIYQRIHPTDPAAIEKLKYSIRQILVPQI